MSIEIKVPFPKYEGMEVKKVAADIENGYSVVEYGEKEPEFKKGDIVSFVGSCSGNNHTVILESISKDRFYGINGDANRLRDIGYFHERLRFATESEQQILFDALAKEGKKWNAEKLCIEDIEKDILVPESIGIYKHKHRLDLGLFIGFNNDSQYLGYHHFNKQWIVTSETHKYEKVQCKLTPCKREELKEGDTVVMYSSCIVEPNLDLISRYYKVLPDNKYAKANAESVSVVTIEGKYLFYKVEPIR